MPVRGGDKAQAYFRRVRAEMSGAPKSATVGFHDREIAPLAGQLEYSNPSTNLPERPAFRNAVDDIRKAGRKMVRRTVDKSGIVSQSDAARIAREQRDVLQDSYEGFHGAALSERQIARKGHDQPLVGHEGPKLIGRIGARVDGREV